MSDNHDNTGVLALPSAANAYQQLFNAMAAAGEITTSGHRQHAAGELEELRRTFEGLAPEAQDGLLHRAEAGTLSLYGLRSILRELERAEARAVAATLRPKVEPIDVSLAALGPFDMDAVRKDSTPPKGPYLDGLFPAKGLTLLTAPQSKGKTWLSLAACVSAVRQGRTAVYLDLDGNGGDELAQRLLLLGVDDQLITDRILNVVEPALLAVVLQRTTGEVFEGVLRGLEDAPPNLIVIDCFSKVQAVLGGGDDNSTSDANKVFVLLDRLRSVSSVIMIDHTGHADQGRARGASAKRGAPDCELVLSGEGIPDERTACSFDVLVAKDRGRAVRHHLAGTAMARVAGGNAKTLYPCAGEFEVVQNDDPNGPHFVASLTPGKAVGAQSAAAAAGVDAQRAAECARAVYDAGAAGLSKTALVSHVAALGGALGLSRSDARAWVDAYLATSVADGSMDEQQRGRGASYTWTGAAVPTGDPDEDRAAFINSRMGGGDTEDERSEDDGDDANGA